MINFKNFITEQKNTHLEHLEDEIINNGNAGGISAINFLKSIKKMLQGSARGRANLTVKWDGAPAIICGVNPENGKFFVGTKSVFNVTPKINYTQSDINRNHSGPVADKLSICLKELSKLGIKGILQGDLLFTSGEVKSTSIDGEDVLTFTPNTITYAVPTNSDLAKRITRAKLGIIFHTTYTGRTMKNLKASFGANVSRLSNVSSVFFDDASYKDVSGSSTFTSSESDRFDGIIRMAEGSLSKASSVLDIFKRQDNDLSVGVRLKTFFNTFIREGTQMGQVRKLVGDFRKYYIDVLNSEIDARKTDKAKEKYKEILKDGLKFIEKNENAIMFAIASYVSLQTAKNFLVNKLNQIQSIGTFLKTNDGFKVTSPEGFVAVDRGKAVKLVDRLEFSKANFNITKQWA